MCLIRTVTGLTAAIVSNRPYEITAFILRAALLYASVVSIRIGDRRAVHAIVIDGVGSHLTCRPLKAAKARASIAGTRHKSRIATVKAVLQLGLLRWVWIRPP